MRVYHSLYLAESDDSDAGLEVNDEERGNNNLRSEPNNVVVVDDVTIATIASVTPAAHLPSLSSDGDVSLFFLDFKWIHIKRWILLPKILTPGSPRNVGNISISVRLSF